MRLRKSLILNEQADSKPQGIQSLLGRFIRGGSGSTGHPIYYRLYLGAPRLYLCSFIAFLQVYLYSCILYIN